MKISHNWLQEFVAFQSTPAQLSDTLNMMGIEVESFEDRRSLYTNFVTAKVLTKEKHPKADKLSVCQVYDGTEERTVVCGAPNVEAGQLIVFAQPGAIVPNGGFEIAKRVLRGIESNGMICSKAELNLEDDTVGIWVLDEDTPIGQPIGEALGLSDVIYEISITPNRADALSHLGIARVIAAVENLPLRMPAVELNESSEAIDLTIELKSEDCGRYMARIATDVQVAPSPRWLKLRLESVGLRPRNNIVDITNYVLMECGHPLHAFDYSVVQQKTIVVEHARDSENYITLDAKERVLDAQSLMICDPSQRLAVAGVMGGDNSSIKDHTRQVLIESAWFRPSSVRRTARRLGISSDASYRFERGTDINVLGYALNRAAQLMQSLAGAKVQQGIVDAYPQVLDKQPIVLRFDRLRSILGFQLSNEQICDQLRRLDCICEQETESQVLVKAPSYRIDLNEEIDLIEDVAILWNYDNIPLRTDAEVSFAEEALPLQFREPALKKRLRQAFSTLGVHEVVTQNQIDPASEALFAGDGVVLANPLGEELSVMRSHLLPSALRVVSHNLRQSASSIRLFEFGTTFHRSADGAARDLSGIKENSDLVVVLCGVAQAKTWNATERTFDYYDMKGLVQEVFQSCGLELGFGTSSSPEFGPEQCSVQYNGSDIGVLGEVAKSICKSMDVDKKVYALRLRCDALFQSESAQAKYKVVSAYPVAERDLAFVVDTECSSAKIHDIIVQNGSAILQDVHLFDLFEHASLGSNKKSLAFRLTFSSHERTLTDEEVDAVLRTIINTVAQQLGATLRS